MKFEVDLTPQKFDDVTKTIDLFTVLNHPLYREVADPDKLYFMGWGVHKYLCIFHQEDTASLALYPNGYYCFGCKAKGDVAAFIKATTGLSFTAVVDLLRLINATRMDDDGTEPEFDFRRSSAWHRAQMASTIGGPKKERLVWWCSVLLDKPRGRWSIIEDTPAARRAVISKGAGFFSVLTVDRPSVPCWYFGPWYIDLDGPQAGEDLQKIKTRFESGFKAWDTGKKGYHIEFDVKGASPFLPLIYEQLTKGLQLESADMGVYSMGRGRLWRIEGVRRLNGRRKTRII